MINPLLEEIMVRWLPTALCDPPHGVARPNQVVDLANAFVTSGWDRRQPALVGYPLNGRVQLLSGSHRWAAAELAGIAIPVEIKSLSYVERYFGTDEWVTKIMNGRPAGTR